MRKAILAHASGDVQGCCLSVCLILFIFPLIAGCYPLASYVPDICPVFSSVSLHGVCLLVLRSLSQPYQRVRTSSCLGSTWSFSSSKPYPEYSVLALEHPISMQSASFLQRKRAYTCINSQVKCPIDSTGASEETRTHH
jgi:hypothetical protein